MEKILASSEGEETRSPCVIETSSSERVCSSVVRADVGETRGRRRTVTLGWVRRETTKDGESEFASSEDEDRGFP